MTSTMRDKRFVAEHRGGPLKIAEHRLLAIWASDCAEHVLLQFWTSKSDKSPFEAINVARAWARGEVAVKVAQRASLAAHAAARSAEGPAVIAAARAAGQAVATAHMADHSLGACEYALKAVMASGIDPAEERRWQDSRLPEEIRELIQSARSSRRVLSG